MATAELAVALPVLVVLVAAAMTAISVLAAQLRCVDAAREAARAAARGESTAVVRSLAQRSGPDGSEVQVAAGDREVQVTVSAVADPVGGLLPSIDVHATAVALREPESTVEV
ncbi:MAG TPA: TadE family type IV pilus minor pilin [Mycobacteriales bacterium]|jgi:Flp pilus assembly protein TadG|nr:TadE family type IV pilus minor pilin [Mycobacteriales bacterium]